MPFILTETDIVDPIETEKTDNLRYKVLPTVKTLAAHLSLNRAEAKLIRTWARKAESCDALEVRSRRTKRLCVIIFASREPNLSGIIEEEVTVTTQHLRDYQTKKKPGPKGKRSK